jgi:hypothetical protein
MKTVEQLDFSGEVRLIVRRHWARVLEGFEPWETTMKYKEKVIQHFFLIFTRSLVGDRGRITMLWINTEYNHSSGANIWRFFGIIKVKSRPKCIE